MYQNVLYPGCVFPVKTAVTVLVWWSYSTVKGGAIKMVIRKKVHRADYSVALLLTCKLPWCYLRCFHLVLSRITPIPEGALLHATKITTQFLHKLNNDKNSVWTHCIRCQISPLPHTANNSKWNFLCFLKENMWFYLWEGICSVLVRFLQTNMMYSTVEIPILTIKTPFCSGTGLTHGYGQN